MHEWVRDLMSTTIIQCTKETPIQEVAARMSQHDVSAVVVVDEDGHLAGIITRTDMVVLRAYDEYWQAMQARHVMMHNVITTSPDTTVRQASQELTKRRIHRLIVVEDDDRGLRPVGVLSTTDIVRDMAG